MKKSREITLNGKKVEITKIKVGKFAELMLVIDNLPSLFAEVVDLENINDLQIDANNILTKLPSLLAKASKEIFNLLSVASGLKVEEIEDLDFEELADVITTILEINNIQAVIERFKGLGKTLKAQKVK